MQNSFVMSAYTNNHQKKVDLSGISAYIKRLREMAELKWLWSVLNITGYTAYVYALFISFANVDNVTRIALSVIGALFLLAKFIAFCMSTFRKHRLENLQFRREKNMETAIEQKQRKEELEIYERENKIIKSFSGQ